MQKRHAARAARRRSRRASAHPIRIGRRAKNPAANAPPSNAPGTEGATSNDSAIGSNASDQLPCSFGAMQSRQSDTEPACSGTNDREFMYPLYATGTVTALM